MRTQPKILVYIPFALIVVMMAFPIQIMWLYGEGPFEWDAVMAKLSDMNFLIMGLCPFVALSIYRAARLSVYIVPAFLMLVGFNNGFVSVVGDDFAPELAFGATIALFALHSSLLDSDVRSLFVHSEKRWWLRPIRKQVELPMMITGRGSRSIVRLKTFDLSAGGAFIPYNTNSGNIFDIDVNQVMSVSFNLGALAQFRCQAKVVRIAQAKGSYPAGIGVQFKNLGFQEKRKLKAYVARV